MRGLREISLVSSLHRASTDALKDLGLEDKLWLLLHLVIAEGPVTLEVNYIVCFECIYCA